MIIPCYRGEHHCKWPACPTDCDGRGATIKGKESLSLPDAMYAVVPRRCLLCGYPIGPHSTQCAENIPLCIARTEMRKHK